MTRNRIVALLLALMLAFGQVVALAEDAFVDFGEDEFVDFGDEEGFEDFGEDEEFADFDDDEGFEDEGGFTLPDDFPAIDYEHLVVGHTTAFTGRFSTQMWGNNTVDLDVKNLLFGYNLIEWEHEQGVFNVDPTVVTGVVAYEDAQGNRTFTLALADDLFYSDGTPITAWDYAFSVLLSVAPEVAAIGGNTNSYESLLGMEEYKTGEAKALAGVRVENDGMISFTISADYLPFFYELGLLRCYALPIKVIAPGCTVKDDGQGVYIDGPMTAELLQKTILDPETGYNSHPSVVSGPYKMVSYDGLQGEFEINEYYKGNTMGVKPTIPRLTFKTVENETMMDELLAGELGLINKVVLQDSILAGITGVGTGNIRMGNYARVGYSFVSYNCERPAISHKAVRQAIAYCMEKDAVVSDYVGNFGLRVDGYYGIGQWMYQMLTGAMEAPIPEEIIEDEKATEEYIASWEGLSLDNVPLYNLDLAAAEKLLNEDGWILDREGNPFEKNKDDVRCALIDGVIVPLELELVYPEGNTMAESLEANFVDNLAQVGIKVTMTPMPMPQLLRQYYRQEARTCDMMYLATNFDVVFDPTLNYVPADGEFIGSNYQAIEEPKLYDLAKDMAMTEPGDVLGYVSKWIAFQEYWMEVLPAIPVYSNAYFDFYTAALQNYLINSNATWSQAIVEAYMSDASEAEEEEELFEEELEEGEIFFDE